MAIDDGRTQSRRRRSDVQNSSSVTEMISTIALGSNTVTFNSSLISHLDHAADNALRPRIEIIVAINGPADAAGKMSS
jgi:hypothetical protein